MAVPNEELLVESARQYMARLSNEYHNAAHAETVTQTALELATEEDLSEHECSLVKIAGWYHDIGYLYGSENHETVGANLVGDILDEVGAENEDITRIQQAIRATEVPQTPQDDAVAQVIADADLASLGAPYHEFYRGRMDAYQEFDPDMTVQEWKELGLKLLESQTYMTETAATRWADQLDYNITRLSHEISDGPKDVLVGGTFDLIHEGHRELLRTAFGQGTPTIGITSDDLANGSRERDVRPYEDRKEGLIDEANRLSQLYHREYSVSELTTTKDIAAAADADIIVISPEPKTKDRVESINKAREEEGKDPLTIVVSDEVYAADGKRISSTRIRNGEIDTYGNPVE